MFLRYIESNICDNSVDRVKSNTNRVERWLRYRVHFPQKCTFSGGVGW